MLFQVKWTPQRLQDEPVLFADFMDADEGRTHRIYRPITDRNKLTQVNSFILIRTYFEEQFFFLGN